MLFVIVQPGTEMSKGKKLTELGGGEIQALNSSSGMCIVPKVGKSKTVVNKFLKLKHDYEKISTYEKPQHLSLRGKEKF